MIESNLKNTIARLIHSSKNIKHLNQIHSHIITTPNLSLFDRSFLISRFIFHLCAVSDSPFSLCYANKIFNLIPSPSLFTYNAMIRAKSTKIDGPTSFGSLILYKEMLGRGLVPDSITLPFVLKECSTRVDMFSGRTVHGHAVGLGFAVDVYVQNALINLYSECGLLEDARRVFDEMPHRDIVSWNSMIVGFLRNGELDLALGLFRDMNERKNIITWNSVITGLARGGRAKEALDIFHEMQQETMVRPDKVTVAGALSACASIGAIDQGKWVHSYLQRSKMGCDMVIDTALVDMYGKCGYIEKAYEVFKGMHDKDVLAWTVMISVLALNGLGDEAFGIFTEMEAFGVGPNAVTFVSLLSACAHSGLVEKGRLCFDLMRRVYRIEPRVEHYACMVDILGRAGLFNEAEEIISSMPMRPDVFVWGALLGACQMHGNVELGERVARDLIELEPHNHAFYVVLCDLYAKSGRFEDRKRIRGLMKDRDVKKTVPGSSMIEVDGVVCEFSVRGSSEMPVEALRSVLLVLSNEMKIDGNNLFIYF
ncbi:hypothetical protein CASFOL_006863 [Castilleja foliolosa]|uniref:Chlororespiratory reduction 4 n=1 Tax=Castilleja foliolosa TaxID=1961234 RepID=A0ABD3E7K5_9LAMI